ncbi:MAG: SDR family oxidoreductase [Actinomycetota bacterium]|nr:SDR family oxidoreductase [Actinomycetota bacterium]
MKALVTGGGGFIGSALAHALVSEGHEVRVFDAFITGFRENVPVGSELIEGDLRDVDAVRSACRDIEVVYHQAAIRSVPRSVDDPVLVDGCNVRGTLNVLMAAKEAGCRKVVYASSSSVYGDNPEPQLREDMAPDPISPYGVSKLAGELYARVWSKLTGLPTVSLRYFNVYGPRQHKESLYAAVFPAFVSALLAGEAPEVHWDGEQTRDFTYIDDVVEANLRAASATEEADGKVFNIGNGDAHSVNEVLDAVSKAVGEWIEPIRTPRRAGDVRHTLADISEAERLLGWRPASEWQDAVEATVEWFRSGAVTR